MWNLNWFPGRAGRLVGRLPALEGGEGTGSGTPRLPCCGMGECRASLGISGVFCLYLQMEETISSPPHLLMVLWRPEGGDICGSTLPVANHWSDEGFHETILLDRQKTLSFRWTLEKENSGFRNIESEGQQQRTNLQSHFHYGHNCMQQAHRKEMELEKKC